MNRVLPILIAMWMAIPLQAADLKDAQPRMSIDLSRVEAFQRYLSSGLVTRAQVAFTAKDLLAVSFLHPCRDSTEVTGGLKQRDEPRSSPCTHVLVILFINSVNGQVEKTLTFATPWSSETAPPSGPDVRLLLPTLGGEFLVYTGTALLRVGPSLKTLETRPIGNPQHSVIYVSPGGTLVLASELVNPGNFRKFIFSSTAIEDGRFFGTGSPGQGLTDAGEVLTFVEKGRLLNPNSEDFRRVRGGSENCPIRVVGAPWCLALCRAEDTCNVVGDYGWLVGDETFAIRKGKSFMLIDRGGRVLYRGTADDSIDSFTAGPPGTQMLVVKGGHVNVHRGAMDWRYFARVVDLQNMSTILEAAVGDKGVRKVRGPDVALAPDGTQLAILAGSELRLYQVPRQVH